MASKKEVDKYRTEVKAILAEANIHLENSLKRVDKMGDYELAELRGLSANLAAFFDFNGICASVDLDRTIDGYKVLTMKPGKLDPAAFFDFNGIC